MPNITDRLPIEKDTYPLHQNVGKAHYATESTVKPR